MKKFVIPALLLAPMMAFAALGNVNTLVADFGAIVDLALPIVGSIALLALFWGIAMYIFASGDENKKDKAKHLMIWSVVALFVMVSIWGITTWIGDQLGIDQGGSQALPTVF